MHARTVAALLFVIVFSHEGICADVDFDVTQSHTEEEWDAFYSYDNPNLTPERRAAALEYLRRLAARNTREEDTDQEPRVAVSRVQLVKQAKPAVVQIVVDNAKDGHQYSGTGFFISPDGYLITAAHVIAGASSIEATTTDGTQYIATRIAYRDKDADIAILKFDCSDVTYLNPSTIDAEEGENVIVIGSPELLAGTISTGIVSAIREDEIQISAPISHGSSGSPVLNESGLVIGVARSGLKNGQNLNFAVRLVEIWRAMGAVKELHGRVMEIIKPSGR